MEQVRHQVRQVADVNAACAVDITFIFAWGWWTTLKEIGNKIRQIANVNCTGVVNVTTFVTAAKALPVILVDAVIDRRANRNPKCQLLRSDNLEALGHIVPTGRNLIGIPIGIVDIPDP